MVEITQTETSTETEVKNQPETHSDKESVSNDADQTADKKNETEKPVSKPEKMLAQSEVDRIVYGNKMEAHERGKREGLAEARATADLPGKVDPQTDQVTLSKAELKQLVEDTATEQSQKEQADRVVRQFVGKLQLGMQKYSDFDETVSKLNIVNLPPALIDLVTSLDNTADVVYELAKNPSKFSSVLNLCNTSLPLAYDELTRLSDSIKKNHDAANQSQAKPNEPLDQAKPSNVGTDNDKNMSVSELRKQPWLQT